VTDTPTEREEGGAWAKLRRRKVVQWGVAYAAGAWGFLQGVQFLAEAFEWSSRVLKLSTLAFVLGLPVVLVLAWYHGDRGEQRVTRVELAIVTLLFLIGGGLFWRYHSLSEPQLATTTSSAPSEPAEAIADPRPSIAVLPFDNRSAKQDDTYFVDGIHDDILTQLSKVSGMRVISRTSVEQFRDTKLPIKSIAEQLGVAQILEGGVQRAGERVRVTVQLIDANTDAHLWAENYDRELTAANIFAIQSEVATAIAGALKATLTAGEKARVASVPTQNLEAWEAYQLGRQRMAKRTSAALADAERFFHTSIDLDPTFALAHVGLADALILQTMYSGKPLEGTLAEADTALSQALRLNPDLGEAWASSASIAKQKDQFDRAESQYRKAIELNSNYATAHQWLSGLLLWNGRIEEALSHAEEAVRLDPLSAIVNASLGDVLEGAGRFAEAETYYRRAVAIDPAMPGGYARIGTLDAYALNRLADAVPFLNSADNLDPGDPENAFNRAAVLIDLGEVSEAMRLMEDVVRHWPDTSSIQSVAASILATAGDWSAAVQLARTALEIDPRNGNAVYVLATADLKNGDASAARSRYAKAYPDLLAPAPPQIDGSNYFRAVSLASILQETGEEERVIQLLDGSETAIGPMTRLSVAGYGITDVRIHALRGDKARALAALREAEKAGWRGPLWRFYRDIDPALASIREEPEFKAVFADIERDMARQRAALAARPKDAPLEVVTTH